MNDFVKFPLALTVIVVIASAGLSKVYMKTKGEIERQEKLKVTQALALVAPEADSFSLIHTPSDSYWVAKNDSGDAIGLSFIGAARGYSSQIRSMVGIDLTGRIQGISVLGQQETPGLGNRIEEIASKATIWNPFPKGPAPRAPWFQQQFAGLNALAKIGVRRGKEWCNMDSVAQEELASANSVSALTGATISTEALVASIASTPGAILAHYNKELTEEQAPEKSGSGE